MKPFHTNRAALPPSIAGTQPCQPETKVLWEYLTESTYAFILLSVGLVGCGKENRRPLVADASAYTSVDACVSMGVGSFDLEGDELRFEVSRKPDHGEVTLKDDVWVYVPKSGYRGPDGFRVEVSDGHNPNAVCSIALTVTKTRPSNVVYAWGSNGAGELGDGSRIEKHEPVLVKGVFGIQAISAGYYNSAAVDHDGRLYLWGRTIYAPPSDKQCVDRLVPTPTPSVPKIQSVSLGAEHLLLLDEKGKLLVAGQNHSGQIGMPAEAYLPLAHEMTAVSDILFITAWADSSQVVTSDGLVVRWGYVGEFAPEQVINQPTVIHGLKNVKKATVSGLTLDTEGHVLKWTLRNRGEPVARKFGSLGPVMDIASGGGMDLVVKGDGSVWWWGRDVVSSQAIAEPEKILGLRQVTKVAAGFGHYLAIDEQGHVWSWGYNDYGQLGDGSTTDRPKTPRRLEGLPKAVAIACGKYHSLMITE